MALTDDALWVLYSANLAMKNQEVKMADKQRSVALKRLQEANLEVSRAKAHARDRDEEIHRLSQEKEVMERNHHNELVALAAERNKEIVSLREKATQEAHSRKMLEGELERCRAQLEEQVEQRANERVADAVAAAKREAAIKHDREMRTDLREVVEAQMREQMEAQVWQEWHQALVQQLRQEVRHELEAEEYIRSDGGVPSNWFHNQAVHYGHGEEGFGGQTL